MFRAKDAKYERAKFVIRQTAPYPIVGPREHALHFRNSLHALYEPSVGPDVRFVVALLNSKLLRFAYVTTVREAQQRVFPQVKLGPLGRLPIRNVDLSDATEKARHDRIVNLVEALLALQREQRAELLRSDPRRREPYRRDRAARRAQIDALDEQIDAEVFALYELTAPDIRRCCKWSIGSHRRHDQPFHQRLATGDSARTSKTLALSPSAAPRPRAYLLHP